MTGGASLAAQVALLADSAVRGTRDAGPDHRFCKGVGQAQKGGWHKEGPGRVEVVVPLPSSACQELCRHTVQNINVTVVAWVGAAAAVKEAMPAGGVNTEHAG